MKTIKFFRRKLSRLREEDTILLVTSTFSLKQGQTRISSGPIWVSLNILHFLVRLQLWLITMITSEINYGSHCYEKWNIYNIPTLILEATINNAYQNFVIAMWLEILYHTKLDDSQTLRLLAKLEQISTTILLLLLFVISRMMHCLTNWRQWWHDWTKYLSILF